MLTAKDSILTEVDAKTPRLEMPNTGKEMSRIYVCPLHKLQEMTGPGISETRV